MKSTINQALAATLGALMIITTSGCTKTEYREDTTTPTKTQTRVYALTSNYRQLRETAIKLANTIGFEGSYPMTDKVNKEYGPWPHQGDSEAVMVLNEESWEVSYSAYDDIERIENVTPALDRTEVLKRGTKFFTDMGLNLTNYKLTVTEQKDYFAGWDVLATLYIDGAPVDFFAAPYSVTFHKNYEIIAFRYSATTQTQIGVTEKLTAQQALQNDPTRTNTPLTAPPTPTAYAQKINQNTSLLIPGYNLPILKNNPIGVSVLAITQPELKRLTTKAKQIPGN
jgi:hypothetical protein